MSSASLRPIRPTAIALLVLATALWGISFPAMKALTLAQQELVPAADSWFFASLGVTYRFAVSAVVMLALCARSRSRITRLEWSQGIGLGLFSGGGMLLQMDGLAHTEASTSAFLTQCYCLLIPLWVAVRDRRAPAARVLVSCALVMGGVAVLAGVDWQELRLGRGEVETLLASVLFTGQILWLERPRYARNNVNHFSLVMFAVMALLGLPVAAVTAPQPADWLGAYRTSGTIGLLVILALFSTLGGFLLMNRWQRHVTATEAGLIYCCEPVFASLLALFLPAWFSRWVGIAYANEWLTGSLLVGGGLITVANGLLQLPRRPSLRAARLEPERSVEGLEG